MPGSSSSSPPLPLTLALALPPPPPSPQKKRTASQVQGGLPRVRVRPSPITGDAPPQPCRECGKLFHSWKALFGHMRCHPERLYRGITPPPNLPRNAGEWGTHGELEVAAILIECTNLMNGTSAAGNKASSAGDEAVTPPSSSSPPSSSVLPEASAALDLDLRLTPPGQPPPPRMTNNNKHQGGSSV